MFNSERTYDFCRPDSNFALVILDAPEHLQEVKNKLWLKFDLLEYTHNPTTSPLINWVGYIDLDDMSFKNDSSFIKFPIHENFPVKGYTMNTIINKFRSALYITGGEVYSKKDNSYTASNSFYKYNFTTKEWIDMTYSTNKNLKPLFDHKSVVINNRCLVILGGKRRIIYNSIPREYDSDHPEFEHNSLYNLTIFDTYSNIWENFNIIPDIFDTHIATLQFLSLIATVHKDKIIVLSGLSGENRSNIFTSYEYSGIFDFKSKTWAWFPILNEDGSKYHRFLDGISVKIPNDQIIIFDGKDSFITSYFY